VMAEKGWEPPVNDNATTAKEVEELVETVNCHPHALVLLAREVAAGRVCATKNMAELMAKLEEQNKGDRENSLYASVEVSLLRLPDKTREQVRGLGVFHGVVHFRVLADVLLMNVQEAIHFCELLVAVGLAEMSVQCLLVHPALCSLVSNRLSDEEQAALRGRWFTGTLDLIHYLYKHRFRDAGTANAVLQIVLGELLMAVEMIEEKVEGGTISIEKAIETLIQLQKIIIPLGGHPDALEQLQIVFDRMGSCLERSSKTSLDVMGAKIELFLATGNVDIASRVARQNWELLNTIGSPDNYQKALALWNLARCLGAGGASAGATRLLNEALRAISKSPPAYPTQDHQRLLGNILCELGHAFQNQGHYDEAREFYKSALEVDNDLDYARGQAHDRLKLGILERCSGRLTNAMDMISQSLDEFQMWGEETMVQKAWLEMGTVYQEAGCYDDAETAYRKSLEIEARTNNRDGQAATLNQLGNLYDDCLNRPEEAVIFCRQAADIFVELKDMLKEGAARNNIAKTLYKLKRYDEARQEIMRAVECDSQFGHNADPWKTFAVLQIIETADGNHEAARVAWQQARAAYLAYRQQGGYEQSKGGKLVEHVLGLIAQQKTDQIEPLLNQLANDPDSPSSLKQLIQAVVTILNGSRDTGLADDPALNYADAAEILFLIERLDK
jgi:tetratricopeptide (TPR) repeat protein